MAQTLNSNDPQYLIRDNQYARRNMSSGTTLVKIPKQKHTFMCYLKCNQSAVESVLPNYKQYNDGRVDPSIFGQIEAVDVPSINYEIDEIDQYNRKRLVQKKVNYEPLTIVFYDDGNSNVHSILEGYFRYYYGDARNSDDTRVWNTHDHYDQRVAGSQFGRMLTDKLYPYLENLNLFWFSSGNMVTIWNVFNPLIAGVKYETLNLGDSDISRITMTIQHEGYICRDMTVPYTLASAPNSEWLRQMVQEIGFIGDFANPDFNNIDIRDTKDAYKAWEILNSVMTLYYKYNGRPTAEQVIREALGLANTRVDKTIMQSIKNFSFGSAVTLFGIATQSFPDILAKVTGNVETIASTVSDGAKSIFGGGNSIDAGGEYSSDIQTPEADIDPPESLYI